MQPTCITCERTLYSRGLCQPCFATARRLIRLGQATEAELVERKLMLPKKSRGPKAKAFSAAFNASKAEG